MRALSLSHVGLALHCLSWMGKQYALARPAGSALHLRAGIRQGLAAKSYALRSYVSWRVQYELDRGELPISRTGPYRVV